LSSRGPQPIQVEGGDSLIGEGYHRRVDAAAVRLLSDDPTVGLLAELCLLTELPTEDGDQLLMPDRVAEEFPDRLFCPFPQFLVSIALRVQHDFARTATGPS
jgi:hypothetical protein